jgi:hypothetical protein
MELSFKMPRLAGNKFSRLKAQATASTQRERRRFREKKLPPVLLHGDRIRIERDEMVHTMTKHAMENHPDTAKAMEKMHNKDPKKWGRETKPKWEATPDA